MRLSAQLGAQAPADDLQPIGRGGWLFLLGVFLVACLLLGAVQFAKPGLIGPDACYHSRVAARMLDHGVLDAYPWTQASIMRDRYVDKEFLFHVLLMPFVAWDMQLGPKLLTVLLGALFFALVGWFLLRHGIPLPWLWLLLLLTAGHYFLFRLSLTRPHLLSMGLTVLAAHLLLRRHRWGLGLLALVFPLAYTAAHMLICLLAVYLAACALRRVRIDWWLVPAVVGGTLLGLVLHPNREHIFGFWLMQNVEVVANAYRLPALLGTEFQPPSGRQLVWDSGLVLAAAGLACLGFLLSARRAGLRTVFLFAAAAGFSAMYLNLRRLIEYAMPFVLLFAAAAGRDLLAGVDWRGWLARRRRLGAALVAAGCLLLAFQLVRNTAGIQAALVQQRYPRYAAAGRWLDAEVPAGETVFTGDWASSAYLSYFAPGPYFLVALDPTMMAARDEALFALWQRIRAGEEPDAARLIRKRFGARWVLVERDRPVLIEGLLAQALASEAFALRFWGPEATVFEIALSNDGDGNMLDGAVEQSGGTTKRRE